MSVGTSFKEIEHKFIVPNGFDRRRFFEAIEVIKPLKTTTVQVEDTYYVLKDRPLHVFRHRFDRELQQLTVKSVEKSPIVRTEINLELVNCAVSQGRGVAAFFEVLGLAWSHKLEKDTAVAYFPDCEIVHYRARCGDRAIECVEFEALGVNDVKEALPILMRYETALGFGKATPESKTLFELLLLADAPPDIVRMFIKS